jgi:hypothetical protein
MKIRKEKKTVTKRSNVYSKLIERLETDLLMARSDIQQMKQDKDQTIAELRTEKAQLFAKCSVYELNINRRVGIDPVAKAPQMPNFKDFSSPPPMTRWQQEVRANDERNARELAEESAAKQTAKG